MSVKITFWARPSAKTKDKKSPIYLRLTLDNLRSEFSVGEYIKHSLWDSKSQKVRGFSEEVDSINGKLDALKSRARKVYNELLLSGQPFNVHTVKDKLINGLGQAITFNELFEEYIQKMTALKGNSYTQPTIIKYRSSQKRVSEFVKRKYKRNSIYLYELDYKFIDDFSTFLKTEYNNGNTTIYKHYWKILRM